VRRNKQHGLSLIQTIVVLAIIATVGSLTVPSIARAKRETRVLQCVGQMNEIAVALQKYRDDHQGRPPIMLYELVPKYLGSEKLICPFVRQMAPEASARMEQGFKQRGKSWCTYFYFSQSLLDNHAQRGINALGFSDVLKQRGGDTPVVMCPDHREPRSINPLLGVSHPISGPGGQSLDPASYPRWDLPEEPVIVLRHDGRVQESHRGGMRSHFTAISTIHELETL
jgi:type II secretory pathway pseudopilin PulG